MSDTGTAIESEERTRSRRGRDPTGGGPPCRGRGATEAGGPAGRRCGTSPPAGSPRYARISARSTVSSSLPFSPGTAIPVLMDVEDFGVLVLVGVPVILVGVAVQVDEVGGGQEGPVREDLLRGPRRQDPPIFPDHEDPPGDLRDDVQVMGGRHHRFPRFLRLDDRVDERPAAPRGG